MRAVEAGQLTRKLSYPARLVLLGMACNAHDETALYFRGWSWLGTQWLGYDGFDSNAKAAVARAIAELVAVGLVAPVEWQPGRSPRRVYAVIVPTGPRR